MAEYRRRLLRNYARSYPAIAEAVRGLPPHILSKPERYTRFSGLEPLVLRPDSRFVNIGERTNVTGSPSFFQADPRRPIRSGACGGSPAG